MGSEWIEAVSLDIVDEAGEENPSMVFSWHKAQGKGRREKLKYFLVGDSKRKAQDTGRKVQGIGKKIKVFLFLSAGQLC